MLTIRHRHFHLTVAPHTPGDLVRDEWLAEQIAAPGGLPDMADGEVQDEETGLLVAKVWQDGRLRSLSHKLAELDAVPLPQDLADDDCPVVIEDIETLRLAADWHEVQGREATTDCLRDTALYNEDLDAHRFFGWPPLHWTPSGRLRGLRR